MITFLIYFVVAIILFAVAYYAVTMLVPAPAQRFFMVVLVLVGALFAVWLLLSLVHGGAPGLGMPRIGG